MKLAKDNASVNHTQAKTIDSLDEAPLSGTCSLYDFQESDKISINF